MSEFVQDEVRITVKALGSTWGGAIVKKSVDLFATAPVQAGYYIFKNAEYDISKGKDDNILYSAMSTQIFFAMANKLMAGWGAMLFIMCIRFMIILSWFALLAPMLLAACLDGVYQRKIKFYNFKSIRPATFTLLSLIVIPFALAPFFYLVIPIPVSPAIIPIITSFMLFPLSWLLSNSQPLFGEK